MKEGNTFLMSVFLCMMVSLFYMVIFECFNSNVLKMLISKFENIYFVHRISVQSNIYIYTFKIQSKTLLIFSI